MDSGKKKLLISFSGGRTSAYMMWWLFNEWKDRDLYEKLVVFANTGREHAGTLVFINQCSWKFNIPVIWLEGWPRTKRGWGVIAKETDYFSACRGREISPGVFEMTPFEAMIAKLGIPSTNAPFCSDQLKRITIEAYLKQIGWKGYAKAIGIRMDEVDRANPDFRKKKIIYPMIQLNPSTNIDVNSWWAKQSFNLKIDRVLGNCDGCWKKDIKTLCIIAKKYPESFNWWQAMTDKYGHINPRQTQLDPPFNFYRGNLSPKDIFKLSEMQPDQLEMFVQSESLDGCSESCEAF